MEKYILDIEEHECDEDHDHEALLSGKYKHKQRLPVVDIQSGVTVVILVFFALQVLMKICELLTQIWYFFLTYLKGYLRLPPAGTNGLSFPGR